MYAHVSGETEGATGVGNGLGAGPIIGYKWVWDSGFFIDLNGGVLFLVAEAEAEATDGQTTSSDEASTVGPNLNFNLGLSF